MPIVKKKRSFPINESVISVILGALVVFAVGSLIYRYFTNLNRQKKLVFEKELTKNESPAAIPSRSKKINDNLPKRYQVKLNDCLWTIAEKYYQDGYNWLAIAKENKLDNPDLIFPGQELTLPKIKTTGDIAKDGASTIGKEAITVSTYKIVEADNLWNIAIRACGDGFKWPKIAQANQLVNSDLIKPDQVLKINCN